MSHDPFGPPPAPASPSASPFGPFGVEGDRTVVRPRPGARGPGARHDPFGGPSGGPTDPMRDWSADPAVDSAGHARDADLRFVPIPTDNPLVQAAYPILALVPALRQSPSQPDVAALRESLANSVRQFEQSAMDAGVVRESVIAARYVLCAFIDESVSLTPWGGGGTWAADPLLVRFHSETWGGEKVFQLLSRLAEDPGRNHDLLELVYHCLSLGFAGRYRVAEGGAAQLESIRERLHRMIRGDGPRAEATLSPQWRPAVVQRRRWFDATPFWVFCGLIAVVAVGAFVLYDRLLAQRSDPVFAAIRGVKPAGPPPPPPATPPPSIAKAAPSPARLGGFLQPEVAQGLVAVRDEQTRSIVTIRGDGMFASGSATVSADKLPVIDRIGKALAQTTGKVVVSGHTDNQPIRSTRFPSNWNLSQERAQSVRQRLTLVVPAQRIQAEGRADQEPIASNDTPAGRSQNRRIEITLFATP